MEREVKIYALIDPITLKIRYVGRTVRSLPMRLSQHVHCAKTGRLKTHKEDWIRSLLKINSRPYIRLLKKVIGWSESYNVETAIINRYRHRLLNHDDRGEGCLNRNLSQDSRNKISSTLTEFYKTGGRNAARKIVYCYNEDGSFYKEYPSIRAAGEDLGLYFKTISKHLNGVIKRRYLRKGKQFSFIKVERMHNFKDKVLPPIGEIL